MTSITDVADPHICHFCSSANLEWEDGGWAFCRDCTAAIRCTRGQIVDTEPPDDLQTVSDLLHELRRG